MPSSWRRRALAFDRRRRRPPAPPSLNPRELLDQARSSPRKSRYRKAFQDGIRV
jgi:hypothetical protein